MEDESRKIMENSGRQSDGQSFYTRHRRVERFVGVFGWNVTCGRVIYTPFSLIYFLNYLSLGHVSRCLGNEPTCLVHLYVCLGKFRVDSPLCYMVYRHDGAAIQVLVRPGP